MSAGACLCWIAKLTGRDFPPVTALDSKHLNRNSVLLHVTNSSRRMIVAVSVLQVLRRDVPVFQDVLNDCTRTFGCDAIAKLEEVSRKFRFHLAASNKANCCTCRFG